MNMYLWVAQDWLEPSYATVADPSAAGHACQVLAYLQLGEAPPLRDGDSGTPNARAFMHSLSCSQSLLQINARGVLRAHKRVAVCSAAFC